MFVVRVLQLKLGGSLNAGWEGSVCNSFHHAYTYHHAHKCTPTWGISMIKITTAERIPDMGLIIIINAILMCRILIWLYMREAQIAIHDTTIYNLIVNYMYHCMPHSPLHPHTHTHARTHAYTHTRTCAHTHTHSHSFNTTFCFSPDILTTDNKMPLMFVVVCLSDSSAKTLRYTQCWVRN